MSETTTTPTTDAINPNNQPPAVEHKHRKQIRARPRYMTEQKPQGGIWDDLGTALWDLGTSRDADPLTYQVGSNEGQRANGPAASVTFKLSEDNLIGKMGDAARPEVKRMFGHEGELKDAPPDIKQIAYRAPVYIVEDYYIEFDHDVHVYQMRVWLRNILRGHFNPGRTARGTYRLHAKPNQEKRREKGTLTDRCFVWAQTIKVNESTSKVTGWVAMGVGDLDYPDRPYPDGGLVIFKPMKVMIEGKERTLSILQVLGKLIVEGRLTDETGKPVDRRWFFDHILGNLRGLNPKNFTDKRMEPNDAKEPNDNEEIATWQVAVNKVRRPLGAKLGDKMPKVSQTPEAPPAAESDTAANPPANSDKPKARKPKAKDRRKAEKAAAGKSDEAAPASE